MPNLNKVMLMGNLTRDPELRYTPNNVAVANIGIAVNRRWRNSQSGEQQEETTFVDCEAWSRTAETINQYLRKGRPIFIEGRLKLDQWQDQNGNNRSKLKVVIENFQFLDSRGGGQGTDGRAEQNASSSSAEKSGWGPGHADTQGEPAPPETVPPDQSSELHQAVNEDDIPF